VHTNKLYIAKLGIGLLPARYDRILGFGHMWLYWTKQENDYHDPFRGYYPVEEQIPQEYSDYSKWPRFFSHCCVQGEYRVDVTAMDIMNDFRDKILLKEWTITQNQLLRLQERCHIPKDKRATFEGYYSWNKRQPGWHNCSSWIIHIINHVMNNPNFLVCNSPKRLSIVEQEIWDI